MNEHPAHRELVSIIHQQTVIRNKLRVVCRSQIIYCPDQGENRLEWQKTTWPRFFIGNKLWLQMGASDFNEYTNRLIEKLKRLNEAWETADSVRRDY